MVVCACHPDDEVRGKDIECGCQALEKLLEIHVTFNIAYGLNIHGAFHACGGGGCHADVDGVGKYSGVTLKEAIGAVTLMGVSVDDHDADAWAFFLKVTHRNSDVIKDTECFAASFECMVGASCKTNGNTFSEGSVAGLASSLGFSGAAGKEIRGDGETKGDLLAAVKGAVVNF